MSTPLDSPKPWDKPKQAEAPAVERADPEHWHDVFKCKPPLKPAEAEPVIGCDPGAGESKPFVGIRYSMPFPGAATTCAPDSLPCEPAPLSDRLPGIDVEALVRQAYQTLTPNSSGLGHVFTELVRLAVLAERRRVLGWMDKAIDHAYVGLPQLLCELRQHLADGRPQS